MYYSCCGYSVVVIMVVVASRHCIASFIQFKTLEAPRPTSRTYRAWQNQQGKKTRQINPRPRRLPVGVSGGQGRSACI